MAVPSYWRSLGDGWHLWQDVELRGAGFPASWLLQLGDLDAARRADEWSAAERAVAEAFGLLTRRLATAAAAAPEELRRALRAAGARIHKGKPAALPAGDPELIEAHRAWEERRAIAMAARSALGLAHGEALRRARAGLRAIGRDPMFREALLWQNRSVVRTAIDPFLEMPEGADNWRVRQREQLVASYVQRYCGKNDRIGFFGPHSWGTLTAAGPALEARPGPGLLARRFTRLEGWAVDALADRLASDPVVRAELRPRRLPTVRLDGTTLHHSIDRTAELPEAYAVLLSACDGRDSARRIAERLIGDPTVDVSDEPEVFDMLDELVARRVLVWGLDVPTSGGRPERLLRVELERIEADAVRSSALESLAELEAARDGVAAAAGQPDQLDQALRGLEETFVRLTGSAPSRGEGKTYAGRKVAFETCHRDVALEIGPPTVRAIGPALGLLLVSARWFTHEIARRYREALSEALAPMWAGGQPRTVPYQRLARALPALFPGGERPGSIVAAVRDELRARWRRVLEIRPDERIVRRSAAALAPGVEDAFAAPGPGWPAARHQSIDVLLDPSGANGWTAVVGEIHTGMNVLLLPELPHPYGADDVLFARRDQEIGRPCVAPVWTRARTHLDYYSRSAGDFELEHADERAWRPRDQVLAAADLEVHDRDGIVVASRDGRACFDLIAFLEQHLIAESHQQFGIAGGDGHVPRVEIDGVVIARERWSAAPGEVDFASVEDPVLRYARARAWAAELGLPRFLFLRTPEEVKPTYVDLASPVYVDLAARMIRAASALTVSEMLPTLDQAWLSDAQGRRYTSEVRLVAVDPKPWTPPASEG